MSSMRGANAENPVPLDGGLTDSDVPTLNDSASDSADFADDARELPPNVVRIRPLPVPADRPVAKPIPLFGNATIHLPEWPIVLVLTGISLSLSVAVFDSFRRGGICLAASLVLAFFFRLVLNDRDAGMLKVRSRRVDLIVLGVLSALMLVFAIWVPAPS